MPLYSIKGPDGNTYQIEGPEGATREQIIDAIQYKLGRQAKPAVKPETTVGGGIKELFKGLAPGAINLAESVAIGASALLPEDTEKAVAAKARELAKSARAPFAAAPGYEDSVLRKLGEAGGSTIPFFALGPFGLAGRAGMAALGTGAGAGEARVRAEEAGATAGERGLSTALGSVVGISEMFAPLRILGRLDEPLKQGIANRLRRIATAGGEEAAQEAAAQAAQNLIAKGVYKPDQAIIEQVGESAAYGGAVGALAQGLLDLALGRRAKGTGTPDEIAQARAEADAAAAAEQERKASPEYAQQFVADYETREQAFIDAKAQLKRPGKDATPAVWAAYKEQKLAVDAMDAELKKDAKEYNQLAPKIKAAQQADDEARAAALETETAGMGEAVQAPYYMPPPVTPEGARQEELPGFGGAVPRAEPTAPAPEFVDYNAMIRQLEGRREQLSTMAQQTTSLAEKRELSRLDQQAAAALAEAQRLVKETKPPADTAEAKIAKLQKRMQAAEEAGDLALQGKLAEKLEALGITDLANIPKAPGQVTIPLQPFKTQVSTKEEYNLARLRKQPPLQGPEDIESQERDYLAEAERQRQEAIAEAEREQKITPEILALRRIKAAEEPAAAEGVKRTGQVSGLIDKLGESLRTGKGPVAGRVVSGGVETDLSQIEELRAQLAYASATNDKTRQQELRKQLEDIRTPDDTRSVDDLDFGESLKQAGVEGRLTPEAMAGNRVTRMSQSQLRAYDKLADFVRSIRESDPQLKRTAGEERVLADAAERFKDVVAGQALLEVNARREQVKQEALSTEKQAELVGRINKLLNELVFRGAPLFNKLETPAVTRGTLTLRSAETRRPPRGQQVFPNFTAAASSLRAQMRSIMDTVGGIKAPPAAMEKKAAAPRIVMEGLRREPEGRERAVEKQFEAAFDRAKTDDDYRTLKELQRRRKNLSPESQQETLEQVRRVATGRALDLSPQLQQELATSRRAGESDLGQEELFTGTSERGEFRTTPEKFQKYLGSAEVQKKIAALRNQQERAKKQADKIRTQSDALQAKIAQTDKILSNIEKAKPKTEIGKAAQNLKAVLTRGQPAVEAADRVQDARRRALRDITETIDELKADVKASEKDLDQLGKDYAFITQQLAVGPRFPSTREAVRRVEAQIGVAETALTDAKKALDETDTAYKQLLEKHATDTIENSIIRKGEAERQKIEKALKSLQDAEQAASDARIKLLESKRAAPSVGAVDIVRVYRDTADSKVQAAVAKERKNIGKAEETHAAATTAAERAAAIKDIETSYNKVYELLNNAPLKQERMSDTSAAAQKKFDEAQAAELDQTLKLFEETAGIAPLKMRARRTIAFVRDAATGRVQTQVKKESVAQQERRFKQEQETGEYAASKLEELAKANADLRDVQRQINYIDANRAEPRTPARKRQDEARANAVAKRKELEAQIKELKVAQKETVAEARTERQAEKELRKETGRMLRREQTEEESGLLSPARVNYQLAYDGVMWQDLPPKDATKAQVLKQLSQDFEAFGKAPGPNNLAKVAAALREKYARMVETSSQPEKFREYLRELNALDMSRVEAPQALRTAVPAARRPTARPVGSRFLNDTPEQTATALATRYKAQGVADDAEYNGMTFAEAARYGARKTTSPMVRALFERLAEVFDKAPAAKGGQGRVYAFTGTLTSNLRTARGVFSHTDNTVAIAHGRTTTNKTLLHELMHAATFYGLDVNKELDQRVTELRNRVKDWLKTPEGRTYFRQKRMELQAQKPEEIYGLTDNDEFLAELYSDRGFQKLLTQVPSSVPRKNVFTRFIELLSKFFDMPSQAAQSAFADAVALSEEVLQTTVDQVYGSPTPIPTSTRGPLLSVEPTYASPEMEAAAKKLDPFVAKQRSVNERVRAASGGFLGLETMLVDRFAGFERLSKYLPEHLGTQMMYYLRMYDMRMNLVAQAVANGAPQIVEKTRKDGKTERLIEAKEGPSIKRTVEILREANPMVGNAEAVNRLFTAYMAGIRADNKGFDSLNFGEGVTPEMLKDALSVVNGNPALKKIFDNARSEYNAYNRNLVEFLVETGAISRDVANRLMAENDYIPFYRERGGAVELLIGKESPIRIGSIKEQPYLQQLVGGDQPILDFLTSSVQNTNFLVDMGMGNLATKNAIYELVDLSAAKIVGGKPSGTNVVKFKDKGVDKYAVLATEKVKIGNKEFETGVPADILVKGMEGVPTQMPVLLRAFALPAQLLRKGVTLSPLYIARQLFRDSLAAPILAGANFTPVLGALRQIGTPTKDVLERRGITGGQQFTGTSDDLSMILRDVADGKPGWMSLLAKAEGVAMSADALTRRAQYNSYVEQGLSEMEATLMSLESMNFSKRGASPSIQIANSMIPFFNAQIQGLNVMYKALTGKMPLNDKLKLREKLLQRGGMMAAASMVYAIMMQEDEAYQNAEADQKYANWFVRIPGVDEPVRIPIPFEIGYIFKALPEAIVNSMASEEGGEQALKALKQIIIQTIPGGSSMPQIGGVPLPLPIPQALKPAIEAGLGKSFYTGRDILSGREKDLLPEEQFRANTAEISKLIGQQAGVSPIILESLVRGYTGTMGLAFLHTLSLGVPPGEGPEKAVKRLSEYPVVGGAFQPNDAGAIINSVYERMNNAQKVGRTYEKMVTEGRAAEANSLLQRRGNEVLQAELGDEFKSNMNQIVAAERAIQASNMSGEEKRKQLDELRKLKIAVAKEIRDVADKTVKLSFSL
jgi:hypothetical protein